MRARWWVIIGLLLLGGARLAPRRFRLKSSSGASTTSALAPNSYSQLAVLAQASPPAPSAVLAQASPPVPSAAIAKAPEVDFGVGKTGFWLWLGYPLAILVAESAIVQNPEQGIQIHLVLLATLLSHAWLTDSQERSLLLALTIVPLARLANLTATLVSTPEDYRWYLISFVPVLFAGMAVARTVDLSRSDLGLRVGAFPAQLAIGLMGIPIGIVEYAILAPAPLTTSLSLREMWLPAATLILCVGFIQEFAFRGVLQGSAITVLGRRGLVYATVLFAMLRVGQAPVFDALFMFFAGLLLAWIVATTRSLLGVSIAHGLAGVVIYLVLPFVGWHVIATDSPASVSITVDSGIGADVQTMPAQPTDALPNISLAIPPAVSPEFPPTPMPEATSATEEAVGVPAIPTAQPELALATPQAEPTQAPPPAEPSPETEASQPGDAPTEQVPATPTLHFDTEEYVVQPGDTLFRIAVKHGTTLELLRSLNPSKLDSVVNPGETIVVPVGFPRKWVSYVVQPGDTLAGLAAARRTTEDALVDVNDLHGHETIEPGQEILVPPEAP